MLMRYSWRVIAFSVALLCFAGSNASAQKAGIKSITADELRMHLSFVASDETEGRGTPSTGANVVAKYLATMAAGDGLKPLMPDGSFFQDIPISVPSISHARSHLTVKGAGGESVFYLNSDFGGSMTRGGKVEAGVVFAGFGAQDAKSGWDDFAGLDIKGKIVVELDGQLPAGHALNNQMIRAAKLILPINAGAAAILNVVSPEREKQLQAGSAGFPATLAPTLEEDYATDTINKSAFAQMQSRVPLRADISHAVATKILGVSEDELNAMFNSLAQAKRVPGKELSTHIELNVETETRHDKVHNVLAEVEGSDPVLKKEYVVVGAHYDHLGIRNGRPMDGANDNGSGTVALLEIAQALMVQRPKRSVILAWFAGEEVGLWGSYHFVNRSPVPLEAITADINLDMIGRNDPDILYLVGSKSLSTELDTVIRETGEKPFGLKLDYTYNDKNHPERYYSRSDNYPFARMGIPAVALFTGLTPDYHQVGDTIDKIDFAKMERICRFTYAAVIEIGNRPALLKLDADPGVTARGKQNIKQPPFPTPAPKT